MIATIAARSALPSRLHNTGYG